MVAQRAAGRVVEGSGSPTEATVAVRKALALSGDPATFQDTLTRAALQAILRQPVLVIEGEPSEESWTTHLYETIGLSWLSWANGTAPKKILEEIERLKKRENFSLGGDGAVHLMTLHFWLDAVTALVRGQPEEAKRLWTRAIEVGASAGTESHATILWTYIASFFPHPGSISKG